MRRPEDKDQLQSAQVPKKELKPAQAPAAPSEGYLGFILPSHEQGDVVSKLQVVRQFEGAIAAGRQNNRYQKPCILRDIVTSPASSGGGTAASSLHITPGWAAAVNNTPARARSCPSLPMGHLSSQDLHNKGLTPPRLSNSQDGTDEQPLLLAARKPVVAPVQTQPQLQHASFPYPRTSRLLLPRSHSATMLSSCPLPTTTARKQTQQQQHQQCRHQLRLLLLPSKSLDAGSWSDLSQSTSQGVSLATSHTLQAFSKPAGHSSSTVAIIHQHGKLQGLDALTSTLARKAGPVSNEPSDVHYTSAPSSQPRPSLGLPLQQQQQPALGLDACERFLQQLAVPPQATGINNTNKPCRGPHWMHGWGLLGSTTAATSATAATTVIRPGGIAWQIDAVSNPPAADGSGPHRVRGCGLPGTTAAAAPAPAPAATSATAGALALTYLEDLDVVLQDCDTPSLMDTPRQRNKPATGTTNAAAAGLLQQQPTHLACEVASTPDQGMAAAAARAAAAAAADLFWASTAIDCYISPGGIAWQFDAADVGSTPPAADGCGRHRRVRNLLDAVAATTSATAGRSATAAPAAALAFPALEDLDVVLQDCDTPSLMNTPRQCNKAAAAASITSTAAGSLLQQALTRFACKDTSPPNQGTAAAAAAAAAADLAWSSTAIICYIRPGGIAWHIDAVDAVGTPPAAVCKNVGLELGSRLTKYERLEAEHGLLSSRCERLQVDTGMLTNKCQRVVAECGMLSRLLARQTGNKVELLSANALLKEKLRLSQAREAGLQQVAAGADCVPLCAPATTGTAATAQSSLMSAMSTDNFASALSAARGNMPRYAQPTQASAARNRDLQAQRAATAAARAAERLARHRITCMPGSTRNSFASMTQSRGSTCSGTSRAGSSSMSCRTLGPHPAALLHHRCDRSDNRTNRYTPPPAAAATGRFSRVCTATKAGSTSPDAPGQGQAMQDMPGVQLYSQSMFDSYQDKIGECIFQAAQEAHAVGDATGAEDGSDDEWGSAHMLYIAGEGSCRTRSSVGSTGSAASSSCYSSASFVACAELFV